jgi:hypothetical protein
MLALFQRDDGAYVRVNPDHIVYSYPENGQPNDMTVLVLTSGDKVKLKEKHTDFYNNMKMQITEGE